MFSKVTIKKNLIILHNEGQWIYIYNQIMKEFGTGMAVRTRLKRELGFTYRRHEQWLDLAQGSDRVWGYCEKQIHLDFYSEQAQTWFVLRYLNQNTAVDQ